MSFRSTFDQGKLININCQIKSGASFRSTSNPTHITLKNIDEATVRALTDIGTPGLIVWVPPYPLTRIYWFTRDVRAPWKPPVRLSRNNYVRPSLRYDLTRHAIYSGWQSNRVTSTVKTLSEHEVMCRAKGAYSDLKKNTLNHPLAGVLRITRLGWRHVTRRSKSRKSRTLALRALPHLQKLLTRVPDRFLCQNEGAIESGKKTIEKRSILCWYRRALQIDGVSHTVVVRIREEISFPTEWDSRPLRVTDITQEATLASWWCSIDK